MRNGSAQAGDFFNCIQWFRVMLTIARSTPVGG
jgi:hypothetical protein